MHDEQDKPEATSAAIANPARRRLLIGGAGLAGAALAAGAVHGTGRTRKDGRYAGKVVLITGATSGIGEATAHAFAREGAKVCFCGRREERGAEVQAAIRDGGGEATFVRADVREEAQVAALVAACVERYGGLDIAFNNAGIAGPRGAFDEIDLDGREGYADVFRTNVDGVFYAMRHEIPVMRTAGGGVIVNTGSMLSHRGSSFAGAYAGSKHAVIGLTRSAAAAEAGAGIRVVSVSPGGVETELLRRFLGGSLEGAGSNNPMGRIAQPQEVADVVLNLVAPENTFLNGDDVKIDGASSA
ncbi:MAG: SDR family oxidoreductase [Gammaproteobacteria bacterium]|nr:SDR family oxidoreductase [Gammaproteobacteria bacterium]